MKLGTLLLRDAIISLSQLEAALRTQVLYGGRLGTNLVELGFLDVETLGTYLAEVLDVPLAVKYHFEAADPDIIAEFGSELAELYTAFPLGWDRDNPQALAVAMIDPRDELAVEQLARQCNHAVVPYVAPELRILYYLEKHYGLTRKARYVRTGTRRTAPASADDRRRTQAPGGIEIPPSVRFEPKPKTPPEPEAPSGRTPTQKLTYQEACDAIDVADHRDAIGNALVEYAIGRFEVAVVFLPRDGNALGWRVYSGTGRGSHEEVEQLGLPLGGLSVLQAAHDSGKPYLGPALSAGHPVEKRLWEALGVDPPPTEMLVVPVRVKQRVVNLVYAHGFSHRGMDPTHAEEMMELGVRASEAYVRLIQETKRAARAEQAQ